MNYAYLFAPILISQISFAAAALPEEALDTRAAVVSLKPIEEKKHVVSIKSYRHAYLGPLMLNIFTGERVDADRQYSGPEHAAGINIKGDPFPKDFLDRAIASRVISGPFRITADHIVSDVRGHWYDAHGAIEITYR